LPLADYTSASDIGAPLDPAKLAQLLPAAVQVCQTENDVVPR
jgi:hypothetical protein